MTYPSPPARAREESTCWRVALVYELGDGVRVEPGGSCTWYETGDRARRAYAGELAAGVAVWLVAPDGSVREHAPRICDRCRNLGYSPEDCALRADLRKKVQGSAIFS